MSRPINPGVQRALVVCISVIGFAVLLMINAALGKLVPLHSDQATVPQYAKAIMEGNFLLKGWELTTVSFYTEIPFYMIGIKLIGYNAELMRLVPAFIHTVNLTLIALLIWKYRIVNRLWNLTPWLILLVLPATTLWIQGLYGPMHHVTAMLGFAMLLILNDNFSFEKFGIRSYSLAILSLIAAWGDLAFLFVFALPIFVTIAFLFRNEPSNFRRACLTVGLPVLVGSAVGHGITMWMRVAGFGTPGALERMVFEDPDRIGKKLGSLAIGWGQMFGLDIWGHTLNLATACMLVLSIGLLIWLWSARIAIKSSNSAIDVFCVAMPFTVALLTLISRRGDSVDDIRMLIPSFMLATLLISRTWQRLPSDSLVRLGWIPMSIASTILSAQLFASNRLMLAGDAYAIRIREPVAFLLERGLVKGFGDFWSCHLLRLTSEGKLDISPVVGIPPKHLAPMHWASDVKWLIDAEGTFLVISGDYYGDPAQGLSSRQDTEDKAIAYWGPPAERHEIRDLVILIWDRPKRIKYDQYPPKLYVQTRQGSASNAPLR